MMPNNQRRSKLIAARYAVNKALIRRIPPTACSGATRLSLCLEYADLECFEARQRILFLRYLLKRFIRCNKK